FVVLADVGGDERAERYDEQIFRAGVLQGRFRKPRCYSSAGELLGNLGMREDDAPRLELVFDLAEEPVFRQFKLAVLCVVVNVLGHGKLRSIALSDSAPA